MTTGVQPGGQSAAEKAAWALGANSGITTGATNRPVHRARPVPTDTTGRGETRMAGVCGVAGMGDCQLFA